MRLVQKRLRAALIEEVREPSEEFCRLMLQRVGIRHLRRTSIRERYQSFIRAAYEEAIVRPVIEHLRAQPAKQIETNDVSTASAALRPIENCRSIATCAGLAGLQSL